MITAPGDKVCPFTSHSHFLLACSACARNPLYRALLGNPVHMHRTGTELVLVARRHGALIVLLCILLRLARIYWVVELKEW